MAKANGKAEPGLPQEFIDQLSADFAEELGMAGPELVAGLAAGQGQSSVTVTVTLNQKPATKKRSAYTEASLAPRVRTPKPKRFYEVELDGQGHLAFEGVLDGPREAPVSQ